MRRRKRSQIETVTKSERSGKEEKERKKKNKRKSIFNMAAVARAQQVVARSQVRASALA